MAKAPLEPVKIKLNPKSPLVSEGVVSETVVPIARYTHLAVVDNKDDINVTHLATGFMVMPSSVPNRYAGRRKLTRTKLIKALKVFCEAWEVFHSEQPEGWLTDEMFTWGVEPKGDAYDKLREVGDVAWSKTRLFLDEQLAPSKIYVPL
jgi:hypothetical protein